MPDTLAYLIACLILFGGPVVFFLWLKRNLDRQTDQARVGKRKQVDDEFITAYGQEAFLQMKQIRDAGLQQESKLAGATSKLLSESAQLNQPSGMWFSTTTRTVVFQAIVDEFPVTPIGNLRYRSTPATNALVPYAGTLGGFTAIA